MIKLQDLSDLMQAVIAAGATFMVSQSGLPGYYNIYAAYHNNKSNNSVHLTFYKKEGVIVQAADGKHPVIEFDRVDDVATYMCKEIGASE